MTSPDDLVKLAPCPFCGSKDGPAVYLKHRVVCGGCDAESPSLHDDLGANVAAWNCRAAFASRIASQKDALQTAPVQQALTDAEHRAIWERESRAWAEGRGDNPYLAYGRAIEAVFLDHAGLLKGK